MACPKKHDRRGTGRRQGQVGEGVKGYGGDDSGRETCAQASIHGVVFEFILTLWPHDRADITCMKVVEALDEDLDDVAEMKFIETVGRDRLARHVVLITAANIKVS